MSTVLGNPELMVHSNIAYIVTLYKRTAALYRILQLIQIKAIVVYVHTHTYHHHLPQSLTPHNTAGLLEIQEWGGYPNSFKRP